MFMREAQGRAQHALVALRGAIKEHRPLLHRAREADIGDELFDRGGNDRLCHTADALNEGWRSV
jgi:hypothetical protein